MLIFVFWCYCDAERKEKSSSYTTRNKMLMWWRTISTWESTWTAEEKISTDLSFQRKLRCCNMRCDIMEIFITWLWRAQWTLLCSAGGAGDTKRMSKLIRKAGSVTGHPLLYLPNGRSLKRQIQEIFHATTRYLNGSKASARK